jgi:hypothetical protein
MPMTHNNSRKPLKHISQRSLLWLLAAGSIAATVAFAASSVNWFSPSAARLVFAGGAPQPPFFKVKIDEGKHYFYVTSRPLFKNQGSKSGAIEKVNIVPVGLKHPPRELEVLRLDKSAIEPSETKEVRCEFLAVIDAAALNPPTPLEFRIHFYGPDEQEVYWEGITIENVEPGFSPPRDRARKEPLIGRLASRPVEI